MGKRTLFVVVVVIVLSFVLYAVYSFGAVKSAEPKQLAAPEAELKDKEATKEEMLAELKENLADYDEVFDVVPELKITTGQDGNAVYSYKNTLLDELSKEDLAKLYGRVRQVLVKIRTDRIQMQLETIRQIDKLQRSANTPRTPAQSPRIPTVPPSVPKTPPSPPQAPQRR